MTLDRASATTKTLRVSVLALSLFLATGCAESSSGGPQTGHPTKAETERKIEIAAAEIQTENKIEVLYYSFDEAATSRSALFALNELRDTFRKKKHIASQYKKVFFSYSAHDAAVEDDASEPGTLIIYLDRTEEAVRHSMLYMPSERGGLAAENLTLAGELEKTLAVKLKADNEYVSHLSANWALKFLARYAAESVENKKRLTDLKDIAFSNGTYVGHDSSTIGVAEMNEATLRSEIAGTEKIMARFASATERAKELSKRLGIEVKYEPLNGDIEHSERVLDILEKESLRPDSGLNRVKSIHIWIATSLSIISDQLYGLSANAYSPEDETVLVNLITRLRTGTTPACKDANVACL